MPSTSVMRTEFRRYLRGKTPWIIGLCFVLVSGLPTQPDADVVQVLGDAVVFVDAQVAVAVTVPFAAAALGFRSIIGERENGTARVLIGTQLTRRQFVLGKTLGRSAALAVPIVAGTIVIVGSDVFQYGRFSVPLLVGLLLISLGYVFAWVGVTVGLSAASSSTARAAVIVFGVTLFLGGFWNSLTLPFLWQFVTGSAPSDQMANPAAFEAAKWLSLPSAYYALTDWLLGGPVGPTSAASQVSDALRRTGQATSTGPVIPLWTALIIASAWPAIALWSGTAVFRRNDLAPASETGILQKLWNRSPSHLLLGRFPFKWIPGQNGVVDSLPGSWQPVARREFRRLVRTPGVWVLGVLVLGAGVLSLSPTTLVQDSLGARVPLAGLQTPIALLGGVGILFGTFRTVTRERDTGSIRVTAGTAASRTNTLVGLVLGRASAFAVPIVGAVLGTCLVAIPRYGLVPFGTLAGFLAVTLVFVGCMAGLGVAISTVIRSQSIAGTVILVFTGLHFAWFPISNALYSAATGTSVDGFAPPDNPIFVFVRWLPPLRLFNVVTNPILGVPNSAASAAGVISDLQENVFSNIVVVQSAYGSNVPVWYLHPTVAFVELILWCVIPFGVALVLYQYRSVD